MFLITTLKTGQFQFKALKIDNLNFDSCNIDINQEIKLEHIF